MVVKLKAYRLAPGFDEEFRIPILMLSVFDNNENIISFDEHYTKAQIDELHGLWGVRYREIYGYNTDGQRTSVRVITWTNTDFITTAWTNGLPLGTDGFLKMDRIGVVFPIIANTDEVIDVSDLVIEDNVEVINQIESLDKYDLRVSRASFSLDESSALTSFMNKYWNPDGYMDSKYLIGVEIEGYFWGISDFENINFDEVAKTYYVDCYDPIKWLQKYIWSLPLPSLGVNNANLSYFLSMTCGLFYGQTFDIEVNDNQNWNYDYVGGYNSDTETYYTLDSFLSIEDFMIELLKHYGAVMYFNASGNMHFRKREYSLPHAWNEDNMLEELNRSYQASEYDGLIINVYGDWRQNNGVDVHYEGWVLIWEEFGEMQVKSLSADLREIPENFRYLDLRQKLPEVDFSYRVFAGRTKEEVYASYRELLRSSKIYETTLFGLQYELYDTISVSLQTFVINYAQKDLIGNTTKIRVYKKL